MTTLSSKRLDACVSPVGTNSHFYLENYIDTKLFNRHMLIVKIPDFSFLFHYYDSWICCLHLLSSLKS